MRRAGVGVETEVERVAARPTRHPMTVDELADRSERRVSVALAVKDVDRRAEVPLREPLEDRRRALARGRVLEVAPRHAEEDEVVVVVGGEGIWNCHVHTDDIGAAIEAGIDVGRPSRIRQA